LVDQETEKIDIVVVVHEHDITFGIFVSTNPVNF